MRPDPRMDPGRFLIEGEDMKVSLVINLYTNGFSFFNQVYGFSFAVYFSSTRLYFYRMWHIRTIQARG